MPMYCLTRRLQFFLIEIINYLNLSFIIRIKMFTCVKQNLLEIRSSYWILRGRIFVKKLLRPCTVCRKFNTGPYEYPGIADLPESRFDNRYPFSATGIDYLGPLYCAPVYGEDKQSLQSVGCFIRLRIHSSYRSRSRS